jgi:hypothetical protein
MAIEAIGHEVVEWEQALGRKGLQHGGRELRFTLPGQRGRNLTFGPSGGIRVRKPGLRQEQTLSHERIAFA